MARTGPAITRRKDKYQLRSASASQPKTLKTYACAREVATAANGEKFSFSPDRLHRCLHHYRALATWYKDQVDAGVGRGSEEGLFFCGCVNYGSSVGDANYQTGFISLRDVGEALLRVGFKDTEVPLKKLRLGLGGRPVEIFTN